MIISTQYNFIFVHIPKTAGMSVTDAFQKYGRPQGRSLLRSFSRRLPFRESPAKAHFRYHDPASTFVRKLGPEVFERFLSFSVVRNPFDHAVSHYEYMKQFRIKDIAEKVGQLSFEEYLDYRRQPPRGKDTIFARLPNQSHYLTDGAGTLLVKRLARFERLEADLSAIAEELALPEFRLRHINKTKSKSEKKPYQDYYTPQTEAIVREIYKPDFALLGYDDSL
ncbi:Sulfotransferase family protein [Pseudoruegeria aquimaris]|uniref:Sulfotransferase family protein n=1 Tax=Pseudoruegeria aquimaris TaxID=393663 RepID=A0A1Y5RNI8_9RHOB|nr:sulfotransferase family 2 domain-containing protein [Pseudoruegeria aquimaris]SLN19037.1 Sulfotransferase family protein [Pseudoruegeria aquimaris]